MTELLGTIDYDKIKEKIKEATVTSFESGQTTVGTTAVQLTSTSTPTKKGVVIKADDDNTGSVYIGKDDTVSTTTGFRLGAGQGITIEVDDTSKIWLIADADNQKVHWIAV